MLRRSLSVEGEKAASISPRQCSLFFNTEVFIEYQEYQKAYADMHVMLTGAVVGSSYYLGRCNLMNSLDDGVYFTYSLISTTCAFIIFILVVFSFVVVRSCIDEKTFMYKVSHLILDSQWLLDFFRDLIPIACTLGLGLGLFGRVVNGACPNNVSLWDSQRCNPVASSSAIPADHVTYMLLMPLFAQAAVNGVTYRGILICWGVASIATLTCIIYLGAWLEIWLMILPLWILILTFKIEKHGRQTFTHTRYMLAAEKEKGEMILLQKQTEHDFLAEKIKHELEICSMKANEECRLMEKEQALMVAMIGNIAHDLKTPLQSFTMDLESLRNDDELCKRKYVRYKNIHIYDSSYC